MHTIFTPAPSTTDWPLTRKLSHAAERPADRDVPGLLIDARDRIEALEKRLAKVSELAGEIQDHAQESL